jgi:hypothetical protein
MEEVRLIDFCLACVKHDPGDLIGRLLAIACLSPYLALIYTFSAAHATRKGLNLSK